jgi:hypothetical protein
VVHIRLSLLVVRILVVEVHIRLVLFHNHLSHSRRQNLVMGPFSWHP